MLDDSDQRWRDSVGSIQLIPKGADNNSPTIRNQVVAERLIALKNLLADVAASWYTRERARKLGSADPTLPEIGTKHWEHHLHMEREAQHDPEMAEIWRLMQIPGEEWFPADLADYPAEDD